MGVHSGAVYRLLDMAGNPIVAGNGINMAQRVMDAGDAGHILLSAAAAEALREIETWRSMLFELGECRVKHGEIVRLFNLLSPAEGIGNPDKPRKMLLQEPARPAPLTEGQAGQEPAPVKPGSLEIALLYKRNAQPDEYVLRLLSTRSLVGQLPTTGAALVVYWQREGVIGTRLDITDSQAYARQIRHQAERRLRE